jgi:succinyl-diaminopimelate desuccinylase
MNNDINFALNLLDNLIRYNTINNPSKNQYPDIGILSYVQEVVQNWNSDYQVKYFPNENYSSIYIAEDTERSCDILFMGHLDVVPIAKDWSSDPFKLTIKDEKYAYGRGAKDCKGSIVPVLLLLKEINEDKNYKHLVNRIGVYFSLDEETGGQYGANLYFQHAHKTRTVPKFVINVDGGPKVVHKRRAGFGVRLTAPPQVKKIKGTYKTNEFETRILHSDSRHSAYFIRSSDTHALISLSKYLHINPDLRVHSIDGEWVKNNVIPSTIKVEFADPSYTKATTQLITFDVNLTHLIRILKSLVLTNLPNEIFSEFGVTINPNLLTYTSRTGTEIQFDVRAFVSPSKKDIILDSFKNTLEILPIKYKLECKGSSGYFYTDPLHPLVTQACDILKEKPYNLMDEDELPKEQEGASDARYATKFNIPVIDLGPKGDNIHGPNEFIDINSMIQFISLYRDIAQKLTDN